MDSFTESDSSCHHISKSAFPKFSDVVKSAQDAAVLVLVY